MTEPIQPGPAEPDLTGPRQDDVVGQTDPANAPDPGYPGLGYGVGGAPRPRLRTFAEMLPATRAFHRGSSKP